MALLLWETLIFEHQHLLDDDLQSQIWKFRSCKYSGHLHPEIHEKADGENNDGLVRLNNAAQRVYDILDPSSRWDLPTGELPSNFESVVFGKDELRKKNITTLEAYAGCLWTKCWQTDPRTFGALCLWTSVWYLDLGNGYRIVTTPLKPTNSFPLDLNYSTNWRMRWRHTWHTVMVCQLVVILPTVISSFFNFG